MPAHRGVRVFTGLRSGGAPVCQPAAVRWRQLSSAPSLAASAPAVRAAVQTAVRVDAPGSLVPREVWVEASLEDSTPGSIARLHPVVWGSPARVDIVHSYVRWHLANRRQGTALVRNKAQVSGTMKKMYRQKGTGRARHGTRKVNIFRGGGKSHGGVPRDHSHKLPKKVRQMSMRVVLSEKLSSGRLIVVDDGTIPSHKTRVMLDVLRDRGLDDTTVLFVDSELNDHLILASNNIMKFSVTTAQILNTYDALRCSTMICTSSAVAELKGAIE